MHKSPIVLLVTVAVFFLCSLASARRLVVAYIEYPPYSYTHDGDLDGILAKSTRKIMQAADIDAEYVAMPGKRIVTLMTAGEPLCAIGAFRTAGRESFAWFSPPTYRNAPLVVVHRSSDERFRNMVSLADVLDDAELILGLQQGYSLGNVMDSLIRMRVRHVREVTADLKHLVLMIEGKRLDYAFLAPEGISELLKYTGSRDGDISWFRPDGMPEGTSRHIMCSQSVPESVRQRIAKAVRAIPMPAWSQFESTSSPVHSR